jgi:hypothetical protein
MNIVIQAVTQLTKRYGNGQGVDGLQFSVEAGQIFGFLGKRELAGESEQDCENQKFRSRSCYTLIESQTLTREKSECLAIGSGLGWWLDRQMMRSQLVESENWRTRVGALEYVLTDQQWCVHWDHPGSRVYVGTDKKFLFFKGPAQSVGVHYMSQLEMAKYLATMREGDLVYVSSPENYLIARQCHLLRKGDHYSISTIDHNPSDDASQMQDLCPTQSMP